MNENQSKFLDDDKFKVSSSCEILPKPKSNDERLVGENSFPAQNTKKSYQKNFQIRESKLTELFISDVNIKSLKNFIWVLVTVFLLDHLIVECYLNGQFGDDLTFLRTHLKGLSTVILFYWLPMLFSTLFIVYYGFKLWTICRKSTGNPFYSIDATFLVIYIVYILAFALLPFDKLLDFPPSTRSIIIAEQIRMIMKGYAFVRTNVPKVIYPSENGEKDNAGISEVPEFSKYVYYIFAPTLVYADDYPRLERIRFKVLFVFIFEFITVLLMLMLMTKSVCIPFYRSYDFEKPGFAYVIYYYLSSALHSIFIFFLSFYGLIHLWMNIWCEILRFGDRKFYSTWWCSTSMSEYYRTWNILVQDWIYIYLFRDFKKIFRKNRILTIIGTMFVSSMVHDYLFSIIAGFYFPYFVISYGISVLTFVVPLPNNAVSNTFVFVSMSFAACLLISYVSLGYTFPSASI